MLREWGSCGRVALVDDEPVGYVIYAPDGVRARRGRLPDRAGVAGRGAADHRDVAPEHRGGGLGRMLVQGMARDLVTRRHQGGRGLRRHRAGRGGRAWCRPSSSAASGSRPSGRTRPTPRMRMDLRTAVTWKNEVEAALERLVGRRAPGTEAATRARRAHAAPRPGSATGQRTRRQAM